MFSSSFDLASLTVLSSLIAEGDQKVNGNKARSRNEASMDYYSLIPRMFPPPVLITFVSLFCILQAIKN